MRNVKKVLITGATGYIGTNFLQVLDKMNIEIFAIINPLEKSDTFKKNKKISPLFYSLDNIDSVEKKLSNKTFDVCYHFAWTSVAQNKNDVNTQLKNIDYSLDMMTLCKKLKIPLFVGIGSTTEYNNSIFPINIKTKPETNSVYGAVKIATRYLCKELSNILNQDFVWITLPGIYGRENQDNTIIPYTINCLKSNITPKFNNLSVPSDFFHIDDIVEAIFTISVNGIVGKQYFIGNKKTYLLESYINCIIALVNKTGFTFPDPVDYIDSSEFYNDTGFIPEISFESGIKKMIYGEK